MKVRPRFGLTIVHLTIILVLLAVVSSVAIPAWFGRPEVTLDSAAKLLAHDLRDVQNRAALYQETLVVSFHEDGQGYSATSTDGAPLISPYGAETYERRYDRDAVFRGVHVEATQLGGLAGIEFSPQGTAIQGARVVLAYKDERRTLRVLPFSGRVEIDGLASEWVDDGH